MKQPPNWGTYQKGCTSRNERREGDKTYREGGVVISRKQAVPDKSIGNKSLADLFGRGRPVPRHQSRERVLLERTAICNKEGGISLPAEKSPKKH